jgi:hypothetical protein
VNLLLFRKNKKIEGFTFKNILYIDYEVDFGRCFLFITQVNEKLMLKIHYYNSGELADKGVEES